MACLIADGDPCPWCYQPATSHPYRWCRICKGAGNIPDPTDRQSQTARLPAWLWRQQPCGCALDDHGIIRRGGIVRQNGTPADDAELAAAGLR
jgi:hypothetical protein